MAERRGVRTRLDHRVEDGKASGIQTSVEKLNYLGYIDGKPAYSLSTLQKWKAWAITTWVGIVAYVIWWFASGR